MNLINNILNKVGLTTKRDLSVSVKRAEVRGYKAAQINRLNSDFVGTSNSINREIRTDMVKVRNRARNLWREDDYLQSFKRSVKANVIGPKGFVLQSKIINSDGTEDKYANDQIEKMWNKWSRKEFCTMAGMFNFRTVQNLVAEHLERDGEFIARIVKGIDQKINPFGVSLELIEPDYLDETFNQILSNGNVVVMGVEVNEWKKPVAFWLKKRDSVNEILGSALGTGQYSLERVLAEDIVFVIDPEHTNQLRAISPLASTLLTHHHLNGYIEGHVVAARIGADKMVMIESEVDSEEDDYEGDEIDVEGNKLEHMAPGITHYLRPGEKANMLNPSYPQGEFWPFLKAMLRKIFLGRGVDYNSTSGDLEGVSYSAMRSGKETERTNFMMRQSDVVDYFITPIFETVLKYSLLYGVLNLPYSKFEKFNSPVWVGKRWPYFDPLKDAQAAVLKINNGLSTRTKENAINGEDYNDVLTGLANEKAEETKLNINYGAPKDGIEFIKEPDEDQPDPENDDESAGSGKNNSKRTGTDGRILRFE